MKRSLSILTDALWSETSRETCTVSPFQIMRNFGNMIRTDVLRVAVSVVETAARYWTDGDVVGLRVTFSIKIPNTKITRVAKVDEKISLVSLKIHGSVRAL